MRPIKPIALALQNSSKDEKFLGKMIKKLVEIFIFFPICFWKQSDDNKFINIGEIYFNKYFIMRFFVWCEGGEQDQLVYIGQI